MNCAVPWYNLYQPTDMPNLEEKLLLKSEVSNASVIHFTEHVIVM